MTRLSYPWITARPRRLVPKPPHRDRIFPKDKGTGLNGTVLSESSESMQARKAVLPGGSGIPAHDPKPMKPLPNPAAWKDGVPQRMSHFYGQQRFPEATKRPRLPLKQCHSRLTPLNVEMRLLTPLRQRTIIHDGWKLIVYPKLKKSKLFNLTKDAFEMSEGLSKNPEYAGKLKAMTELLRSEMSAMDDPNKL